MIYESFKENVFQEIAIIKKNILRLDIRNQITGDRSTTSKCTLICRGFGFFGGFLLFISQSYRIIPVSFEGQSIKIKLNPVCFN